MLILALRTDNPIAEVSLYKDIEKLSHYSWEAHRALAETLHTSIKQELQKIDKDWDNIDAIIVYKGPGSFTGLRIGLTVANALAQSEGCIVHASEGENWIQDGIAAVLSGTDDKVAMPNYGAPVRITPQKH